MVPGAQEPLPRCWITGAGGLIGNALVEQARHLSSPAWEILPLTRGTLELTDFAAVERRFRENRPGLVIHCAALSRSADCEADPPRARQQNIEVTAHIARLAESLPMVFLSTDLVFDGHRGKYTETDAPHPLSVYAETKLEAEQVVLANPRHLVIRTSLNGGRSPTGDRGFNEQMRRAWAAGRTLRLFVDEYRSPLPAVVTARAIWELVSQRCSGVYHLAGTERLSRWEIGEIIAARTPDLVPRMIRASIRDFAGPPRPADCSLDCRKAQARLSFPLPGLRQWLQDHPDEPF